MGGDAMIEALLALSQVLLIDLVLAGDNAVVVGMAAGGLSAAQRHRAILWGIGAAAVLRIGFAAVTTQLLAIVGLTLIGGLLLLWVCWKMYRGLRGDGGGHDADGLAWEAAGGGAIPAGGAGVAAAPTPAGRPRKTLRQAILQILVADVSMSLDNVLAVASVARGHLLVLTLGLLLSVALMGAAANLIAQLLDRHRWIGWAGLLVVLYVTLRMVWDGTQEVAGTILWDIV